MKVLLDTSVLRELLRPEPAPAVLAWFATQPIASLFVSAITQAELLLAVRLLPASPQRRPGEPQAAMVAMFQEDFAERVLPFDAAAMAGYADIVSTRRAAGRPIAALDAQVAAIAKQAGARLATREPALFEGCGVAVFSPWAE